MGVARTRYRGVREMPAEGRVILQSGWLPRIIEGRPTKFISKIREVNRITNPNLENRPTRMKLENLPHYEFIVKLDHETGQARLDRVVVGGKTRELKPAELRTLNKLVEEEKRKEMFYAVMAPHYHGGPVAEPGLEPHPNKPPVVFLNPINHWRIFKFLEKVLD